MVVPQGSGHQKHAGEDADDSNCTVLRDALVANVETEQRHRGGKQEQASIENDVVKGVHEVAQVVRDIDAMLSPEQVDSSYNTHLLAVQSFPTAKVRARRAYN